MLSEEQVKYTSMSDLRQLFAKHAAISNSTVDSKNKKKKKNRNKSERRQQTGGRDKIIQVAVFNIWLVTAVEMI